MQVAQLAPGPLRTFAVVFASGEEAMGGLLEFVERHAVDAASLTALGGFSSAMLAWYDLDAQAYHDIPIEEQVEVVGMMGDVSRLGPGRKVHAHAVVGTRDGRARGGHLKRAIVRPTLEVVVTESPAHLVRRHDSATGLDLLDLERE